jgi:hypothetical protein
LRADLLAWIAVLSATFRLDDGLHADGAIKVAELAAAQFSLEAHGDPFRPTVNGHPTR